MLRLDVNAPTYTSPADEPVRRRRGPRRDLGLWAAQPVALQLRPRHRRPLHRATSARTTSKRSNFQPAAEQRRRELRLGRLRGQRLLRADACRRRCVRCPPTGFTFPVLTYTHAQGCSVTGGYVYRGCAMPDLHGTYFYADICTGFIRTFNGVSGGVAQNQQNPHRRRRARAAASRSAASARSARTRAARCTSSTTATAPRAGRGLQARSGQLIPVRRGAMFPVSPEKAQALAARMVALGLREADLDEQFVRSGGAGRAERQQGGDLRRASPPPDAACR